MTAGCGSELWTRDAPQRLQISASGQLMSPHCAHLALVISSQVRLASSKQRAFIDETQTIPPGILCVKRAFAPGPHHNVTRSRAVHVFFCQTIQLDGTSMNLFDIVDGKINVIGQRLRLLTIDRRIYQGDDHRAGIDVVAGCVWDSAASIAEQFSIEFFGLIEIRHLKNDSKQRGGSRHRLTNELSSQ